MTLPSAGASTAFACSGTVRGGSRKNCAIKATPSQAMAASNHRPDHVCASKATITSAIKRPTMPIQPRCLCAAVMATAAPLIPRLVHQLVLLDPRHHFPQFAADLLDRVLGGHAPSRQHRRRAGAILQDE